MSAGSAATSQLEDLVGHRLDLAPALAGRERTISELPGGLTNHNYAVTTDTGRYVARLSDPQTSLLAIDREAEYRNSVIAAGTGIAPTVVDYVPGEGLLVIDWVDGVTLAAADLRRTENIPRLAAACRQLHAGPRFVGDFDMFAVQRRYLHTVQEHGFRLPPRYGDFVGQVSQIERALSANPVRTVPCHNDLLAGNILDDGSRLWLIDYEYAGNNDPCFELGNIWSESNLGLDQLADLVELYFGHRSPALTARARLLGLMSKYGWTLWASIQDGQSDMDFDFWSWGMEKYDRAVAEFDDPGFDGLLSAAADGAATTHDR